MRKGFVLSFDVFIALSLLIIIVVLVASQNYGDGTFNSLSLRSFSMDMLASFEKSGVFAQSVGNETALRQAVNNLPPNVCVRMQVTNSTNATIADLLREGCGAGDNYYTYYRTFYTSGELYLAKSETWLKQ
ncbi:Uncharacterised protein [uncultured archaeon]|nr:Uncharacterised protein [uncultured archaeon]